MRPWTVFCCSGGGGECCTAADRDHPPAVQLAPEPVAHISEAMADSPDLDRVPFPAFTNSAAGLDLTVIGAVWELAAATQLLAPIFLDGTVIARQCVLSLQRPLEWPQPDKKSRDGPRRAREAQQDRYSVTIHRGTGAGGGLTAVRCHRYDGERPFGADCQVGTIRCSRIEPLVAVMSSSAIGRIVGAFSGVQSIFCRVGSCHHRRLQA